MKSSVISKLTQLIHDEAMKQLAENYHELLPKLVKIDIDHIEEDLSYAVGAAYFMISGRIIFAPIIYRDGAVDSISYIGDTENESLYGLTKKMYKRIISSTKLEFGQVVDKKEQDRMLIDKGIIGRLFATPQTISPKVASDENYHDNVIIDLLNSPVFANSFMKLAADDKYNKVLHKIYSDRVFEKLDSVSRMEKIAEATYDDDSAMIYTKIADLSGLQPKKRQEAALAIARDGFYKVASDTEDMSHKKSAVFALPKIGEMLMKSKSSLEVLTEPGIYNALAKNLDLIPVVVANDGSSGTTRLYLGKQSITVREGKQVGRRKAWDLGTDEKKEFIGMPAGAINDDPRSHIASVFGGEVDPKRADGIVLIASKDEISLYDIGTLTRVGNELVLKVWESGANDRSIVVGENHTYTKSNDTIFINPKHVLFVKRKGSLAIPSRDSVNEPDALSTLLTTSDLDATFVKTASYDITYSAGAFFYGGNRMSREGVVYEMQEQGFDRESINEIIKTAQASPDVPVDFNEVSQTLKAILAELAEAKYSLKDLKGALMGVSAEQGQEPAPQEGEPAQQPASNEEIPPEDQEALKQEIMQVAQSVGANGEDVIRAGEERGMTLPQIAAQINQEVATIQQSQGQQPQGGEAPQEGMATQEGAQPNGQVQGQAPQEQSPEQLQAQGYNTSMSPEMLDQLQQIADKDVLNASIISYLVDTTDAKAVTMQYIDEITRGVNGLARTLLLVEIQRGNFADQVGDKQISSFLSRGKTLLNRMTDFVIDVSIIE